jgi:hypothetical protein
MNDLLPLLYVFVGQATVFEWMDYFTSQQDIGLQLSWGIRFCCMLVSRVVRLKAAQKVFFIEHAFLCASQWVGQVFPDVHGLLRSFCDTLLQFEVLHSQLFQFYTSWI